MKFYRLHENIYVRPHTRGLDSSKVLASLAELNTKLVINVAIKPDHCLAGACRTVGMDYVHCPLHDSENVPAEAIRRLAKQVAEVSSYGGVVIHCDSGLNRAPVVAVRAIMYLTTTRTDDVISESRVIRGPNLLHNVSFASWLLQEPRA